MNPDMMENGRRLESQVAEMMQLLFAIRSDLAAITDSPAAALAVQRLTEQTAALTQTIAGLQQGQAGLEERLQQHVSELASREAALEASRAQLRALTRRLVQVQEDERRSLARDLHDTSSQGMAVLGLGLSVLKRECDCASGTSARVEDLQRTVAMVSEDLHRLSANLRPSTLDRYGLVPASEELVAALRDKAAIEVEFEVMGLDERLPGDVEIALYRIVQEACTNISRYAGASRAAVSIRRGDDSVQVAVKDDGHGFDVSEALTRGGLGLMGMRERAEMLGGAFTVESSPGQGACVRAEVPIKGASTAHRPGRDDRRPMVEPSSPSTSSHAAELARAKALSDALIEITAGMARLDSAEELLAFVLGRAADAAGCDYALIALREAGRWIVSHAYGLPRSVIGQRLVPAAVLLAEQVERTVGVVVVNDTHSDDPLAVAARESGVFSGAGMPLFAAGRFLGAVAFAHNSDPAPFQQSEVAFLRHLSIVISLVLENIQLRQRQALLPES